MHPVAKRQTPRSRARMRALYEEASPRAKILDPRRRASRNRGIAVQHRARSQSLAPEASQSLHVRVGAGRRPALARRRVRRRRARSRRRVRGARARQRSVVARARDRRRDRRRRRASATSVGSPRAARSPISSSAASRSCSRAKRRTVRATCGARACASRPKAIRSHVADAHDLTSTPLGDDHALVVDGDARRVRDLRVRPGAERDARSIFAARARRTREDDARTPHVGDHERPANGHDRRRRRASTSASIAPGERVGLALGDDGARHRSRRRRRGERHATLDLARGELARSAPGMHAEAARHLPKRFVFWAVDTVRAVPWIGPAPIAWLEEKVFALRRLASSRRRSTAKARKTSSPRRRRRSSTRSNVGDDDARGRPRRSRRSGNRPSPAKASGSRYAPPWMRKFASTATAARVLSRTFVRPDEERPYAKVLLVAMDMRQLDLDMEAGTEDPKPLTGPHGPGRIPRDPADLTRVVAAFNGAFKTEHGNYGMMVHKRVLLPPQPGAATVDRSQRRARRVRHVGPDANDRRHLTASATTTSTRSARTSIRSSTTARSTRRSARSGASRFPATACRRSAPACASRARATSIYAWGDDVSATALGKGDEDGRVRLRHAPRHEPAPHRASSSRRSTSSKATSTRAKRSRR